MNTNLLRHSAFVVLLVALAGCGDRRADSVRAFIAANPPPHTEFLGVTDDFQLEAVGDGRFQTIVPVEYRITTDFVTVFDGFGTPEAEPIVARLDAIRTWAEETLPQGDALRTSIERSWQQTRYGFLLKRVEVTADTQVNALVSLELQPTTDGGWLINETSNSLQIAGVAGAPPGIPTFGSAEATQALADAAVTAGGLETLRADWLEEFERRALAAQAELSTRLLTGLIYPGTASGQPVEFVVSRGSDRSDDIVAVLRTTSAQQSSARFIGRIERLPDGSAAWAGTRSDLISPGAVRFFRPEDDAADLLLRAADAEGLLGGSADGAVRVELSAGRSIDLIPETDGSL